MIPSPEMVEQGQGRSAPLPWAPEESSIPCVPRLLVGRAGPKVSLLHSVRSGPHVTERAVPPHLPRVRSPHLSDHPSLSFLWFLQHSGASAAEHSLPLPFLQAQCCSKMWPKSPAGNSLGELLQALACWAGIPVPDSYCPLE